MALRPFSTELPLDDHDHITIRSIVVGLVVGSIIAFANTYFGLQTGFISMMSLQAALLGFGIFKAAAPLLTRISAKPFTPAENVLVQTVAVATGTMPLAAGFVGILPAFSLLEEEKDHSPPLIFNYWQLVLWAGGISLFGVFFAVPLRKQVIIREKLRFPSGSATAHMIKILHKQETEEEIEGEVEGEQLGAAAFEEQTSTSSPVDPVWRLRIIVLIVSFCISFLTSIVSHFYPILSNLPIFDWVTLGKWHAKEKWAWSFDVSWAYIGQGIIMGFPTTLSMLFGCIVGWGILSPIAHNAGWAPGPVSDWQTGSKGWILWVSLGIMIMDAVVSLGIQAGKEISKSLRGRKDSIFQIAYHRVTNHSDDEDTNLIQRGDHVDDDQDAPPDQQVPDSVMIFGLIASLILAVTTVHILFDNVPVYSTIIAVVLALPLSVLAVRALGETDLNPVSGIGKISQLLFAGVTPGAIIPNLVSGAISEAGAQQAGDLMQDLKCGHIVGASPVAQFYGQIIGSIVSVFISAAAYLLFTSIYSIPSETFQIPTAFVWLNTSRLVNGHSLPPYSALFSLVFGTVFALISVLRSLSTAPYVTYLPSGIAFSIGIYNTPNFTLSRVLGGAIDYAWRRHFAEKPQRNDTISSKIRKGGPVMVIIMASGFVLGEGVGSIFNMILKSLGIS